MRPGTNIDTGGEFVSVIGNHHFSLPRELQFSKLGLLGRRAAFANSPNVKALLDVEQNAILCLDDKMRIFDQYKRYACFSGEPGMGDRFFKWAFNNQANENLCERVVINQCGTDEGDFQEFPDDPDLVKFDRADRVFIAVALTSSRSPKIL